MLEQKPNPIKIGCFLILLAVGAGGHGGVADAAERDSIWAFQRVGLLFRNRHNGSMGATAFELQAFLHHSTMIETLNERMQVVLVLFLPCLDLQVRAEILDTSGTRLSYNSA